MTRHVVDGKVGANVRQIGYFAGEEESFTKLFNAYLQLNAEMFERRTQEGQK